MVVLLMALPARANRLFTSGYETNDLTATEWTSIDTSASPTVVTTPTGCGSAPHSGTYALKVSTGATPDTITVRRTSASTYTSGTLWARVYFCITDLPNTLPQDIFSLGNSSSTESGNLISVQVATGPILRARNRLTSTDTDGATTLSLNTWYMVELAVGISDTVGTIDVRLDGASEISVSGVDTLGSVGYSRLYVGVGQAASESANYDVYYDDVAWNDDQGTFETSWPGAGKIFRVTAASDNTVTWTKTGANCSGTTNTDCVDDLGLPDDSSGYNTSSTANDEDRLNKTALGAEVPSDADMRLIHVFSRWGGGGSTGTRTGRMLLWDDASAQTNGPTTTGANSCDFNGWPGILPTSNLLVFDLGTRSKATVDDADFDLGYEPLNSNECRVTDLWGNVEWIEAPAAPAGCGTTMALMGAGCN